MAYIYCITNQINGKQYIGKTTYSVTKRFQEHCRDSKKARCEKRPLYDAMNKYGTENFIVEQILECDVLELSSYEIMYIDKYDTYHNGYNATKGGDGSILFDYNKIIEYYQSGMSVKEVSAKMQCCVDTVSKVLHINNIKIRTNFRDCYSESYEGIIQKPKVIIQLNKETAEYIQEFESIASAGRWLVENGYAKTYNGGIRQKIALCASGKTKSAYRFKWKYK